MNYIKGTIIYLIKTHHETAQEKYVKKISRKLKISISLKSTEANMNYLMFKWIIHFDI